jgi:hypothetical protein
LYNLPWLAIFGNQGFFKYYESCFFLSLLITPLLIKAQSGFGEAQLIDVFNFQVTKVHVADIDGDNDTDVLFIAQNENTIAWYENLDGEGTFGSINYVTQNIENTQYLDTADFDGDGALDIIITSPTDNKVVWYKNLDGQGTFSNAQIIDNNALFAKQVKAADIDGDNDKDVVVAIKNESKVVWYENLDGLGTFSTEKIISGNATGVYSLDIADLDGDEYLDVLTNSSSIGKPSWFKNLDGQGNFGTENIIDLLGTFKMIATDLDGDNDQDLVKEHLVDGVVNLHWYENTDGLGTFIQKQLIADDFQPSDFYSTDLDNDNDNDLLVTYVGDGKITWFENLDGLGTFGNRRIIDELASISIVAADIDGDGYNDIAANNDQSQVVWYKNQTYLSLNDFNVQDVVLVPNPTTGLISIEGLQAINSIKVYDSLGRLVLEQSNPSNQLDISNLSSGLLFVQIETNKGSLVKKAIKE